MVDKSLFLIASSFSNQCTPSKCKKPIVAAENMYGKPQKKKKKKKKKKIELLLHGG